MKVHPAADVWPVLPDDELKALAESIADVGLLEPIVTTPDGELLDGRNRLAACEIAGVEPTTVVYDGDPVAYVLARNDRRRHMTKGQRAMAAWLTATALNNSTPGVRAVARGVDVDAAMVTWARTVAEYARDLIPDVLRAVEPLPLKTAYDRAIAARDLTAPDHNERRLAALERRAADLAEQVNLGVLSITEAEAAASQREQDRRDRIARNAGYLRSIAEGWRLAQTAAQMVDFDDSIAELPNEVQREARAAIAAFTRKR